ncbi:TPA: hypothetical protein ACX6PX_000479 [Photobacterium damselae]
MINLIEKLIKLILINVFFFSNIALSSTIYLNIIGGEIKNGLYTENNGLVSSSSWDYAPNLLPATAWVADNEIQDVDVSFVSDTGDKFNWKSKISGYEFGFNTSKFEIIPYNSGTCSNNIINNDGIFVSNSSNCLAKFKLISNVESKTEPFNLVRPYLDVSNLAQSLTGYKKGIYKANISYKVKYYYELDGVLTYRDFYKTVSIVINYSPIELIKIIKIGDGFIKDLYYDKYTKTVSGQTKYKLIVYGYIPYGMQMSFDNNEERYLIKNSDTNTEIPYYIECDKCNNKIIVNEDGYRTSEKSEIINFENIYGKIHSFDFDIGFKNIKSKDVRSVEYKGKYNVYFEAIM